jgi:hypothetical protein
MKTSNEHERIKKWIGDLMAVYFEEASIEIMPRGQATMRKALKQAGAESDESWCIDGEKEFPDLVSEPTNRVSRALSRGSRIVSSP